jgi:serine protease Do
MPLKWPLVGVIIILAMLGSGAAGAWLENRNSANDTASQKRVVTSESRLISQIAKSVSPSVVSVNVDISDGSFFGGDSQAAGTGIIISSNLIVTNRHVVPDGTTSVSVTLSDGTELKDVSVLARTSANDSLDVAFIKVNNTRGHHLRPAVLGKSSSLQVGDNVVAIGNALGQFQNTVTSGIVSGFGRDVQAGDSSGGAGENLSDLIQTDAAINEGNSGGPLVNLDGEVIGINTAIAGGAQNIGFAIPIDDVRGIIDQVLTSGKFARPYLGVRYVALTEDLANQYELKVKSGALILPSTDSESSSVLPDSPAEAAGLHEKDVIIAVNSKKVDQNHSLTNLLSAYKPGDHVDLKVNRDGRTLHFNVKLGELPS